MRSCGHYQAQLLDHLYGLLEAEESLALIEHAGQCDDCRIALQRADGNRKLLACAAKAGFPAVSFKEPPATLPLTAAASRKRLAGVARPARHWGRWGVAAAILLAVASVGLPTGRYVKNYWQQRTEVEVAETRVNDLLGDERKLINLHDAAVTKAFADKKAAEDQREQLTVAQQKELDQAADTVLSKQMYLVVTGHEAVRPGVPNDYRIETKNMKGEQEKARLDIRVRDLANDKVVHEQKNVASEGNYLLSLSPDLPLKASNQLALEVVARSANGPQQGALSERLTLAKSSYVTQLVTDKPMYQPGETVHFRSLTLDRFTLKPAGEDFQLVYTVVNGQGKKVALFDESGKEMAEPDNTNKKLATQLVRAPRPLLSDPKGATREAVGPNKQPIRGIGAGEFVLPEDFDGGEYTLIVEDAGKKFAPERRKFLVNVYQKPRLNKELKFHQESYGPGDAVIANCKVAKAEGGTPLVAQPVIATIRIDGKTYKANGTAAKDDEDAGIRLQTSPTGEVSVPFKLPAQIERGEGTLSIQFHDGANAEGLVRPIPIVVKKLQIEFFPEGGDLVAGVPNRVYFQARTMLDRAAKVKGSIVDGAGNVVRDVQTLSDEQEPGINQGMGVFEFKPVAGTKYELKIVAPTGIEGKFPLPEVQTDGVALSIPSGVTTDQDPMTVVVHSVKKDRELLVGAYCRGALLDFQNVKARAGQPTVVQLKPSGGVGGVYRVTVFEKNGDKQQQLRPVAERLVYRTPAARLNLSVRADKKLYAPGEKVTLYLNAGSEAGQPLATVLLVGVVDKSVLKMADEKTARVMPTHFLLTSEVRRAEDLEYADVLLSDHAKAPQALDLLLGTQGWRRFIESDPERFEKQQKTPAKIEDMRCKADVDRLKVVMGKMNLDKDEEKKVFSSFQLQQERVLAKFKPQFERLEVEMNEADMALVTMQDTGEFEARKHELRESADGARAAYLAAYTQLGEFDRWNEALRQRALLALGAILLLAGAGSLVFGLLRIMPRAVPIYAIVAGTAGVCCLVVAATFLFERQSPRELPVAQLSTSRSIVERAEWPAATPAPTPDAIGGGQGGPNARPTQQAAQETRAEDAKKLGKDADDQRQRKGEGKDGQDPKHDALPAPKAPLADAFPQRDGFGTEPAAAMKPGRANGQKDKAAPGTKEAEKARGAAPQPNANRQLGNGMPPAPGLRPSDKDARRDEQMFGKRNLQLEALEKANNGGYQKLKEEMDRGHNVEAAKELKQLADKPMAAQAMQAIEPCIIREYAHRQTTESGSDVRSDFTETLYWHPVLVLPNGKGQVSFDLCDSATTFQVMVAGHTAAGRLAAVSTDIQSRKPFTIEAKVPAQITRNDTIDLPVAIDNAGAEQRRVHLTLHLQNLALTAGSVLERDLVLPPNQRTRTVFQVKPSIVEGVAVVTIRGSSEPFGTDAVQYALKVVPEGFATVESFSDVLEGGHAQHEVVLPRNWVRGTLKAELQVYPSTLADLQKGLEGLLREPNGCFEQTSTSNYPNLLILKYLKDTRQDNPAVESRARLLLDKGYQKLVSFECQKPGASQREGYEWFGGTAPAHEALTAYGLLQFRDMAGVGQGVDKDMVERTRKYLLSRRDNKGGFQRNARAIDSFGRAPDHITNAYIIWALTESDKDSPTKDDLSKELDELTKLAQASKDPYFLALVANSLLNRGQHDAAGELLKKLTGIQKQPDGYLDGAETSITRSGGRDLQIETTALAMLAWLKANRPQDYQANIAAAAKWVGKQRGGHGGFGSTQSTILALKALIAFTKFNSRPMEAGTVTLVVNGKAVANRDFGADLQETLTLAVNDAESHFKAGANDVRIRLTGKSVLPYTLALTYQALTPKSPEACPVRLNATLDRRNVQDGETVNLKVRVENATDKGQGMAVAVIGLPAGLNLPEDMQQLKDYARLRNDGTEPGKISHWEIRGRELVLYWRDLAPKQKIDLDVALICRVPGDYRGTASRAYLYYNADHKHWIEPIQVAIAPK